MYRLTPFVIVSLLLLSVSQKSYSQLREEQKARDYLTRKLSKNMRWPISLKESIPGENWQAIFFNYSPAAISFSLNHPPISIGAGNFILFK